MKKKEKETKPKKKPWPTKDAMEQVYALNLWGDNSTDYYSGIGSHQPEIINPYIDALSSFLSSFKTPLVVCDLGCGDFNIGKELVKHTKMYVGVDIVKDLIEYNKENFKDKNLEFQCLDIAVDDLPLGDCAILRQVLQHLSNTEIQSILKKLAAFKYVIITEHIPEGDFEANKDIISGQGYPEDGNLWDSLGDGYKANNLKEDAIKSYEKAIELGYEDSQEKLTDLIKK